MASSGDGVNMTQERADLYRLLGVSPEATVAEIRRAYRRLARRVHPEVDPGDEEARRMFLLLRRALRILTDAESRRLYDRYGEQALEGESEAAASRTSRHGVTAPRQVLDRAVAALRFEDLVEPESTARVGEVRGEKIELDLPVPFADAVHGVEIDLPVRRPVPCRRCRGEGRPGGQVCRNCGGEGRAVTRERVRVRVPEGVRDGEVLVLQGEGARPARAGRPGDLHLRVRVEPHAYFERHGDDVHSEVPVTFREAWLGAEIEIATIHGPVRAKLPPGTSGGQRFRLRGRGVRNRATRAHGDHIYRVNVVVPRVVTAAGRRAADTIEMLYGGPVRSGLPRDVDD